MVVVADFEIARSFTDVGFVTLIAVIFVYAFAMARVWLGLVAGADG